MMGLSTRLKTLFGKSEPATAPRTTDRAPEHAMRGDAPGQSPAERAGTRQRMEAELDGQRANRAAAAPAAASCPHIVLVPRWEKAADMGHEERATGYTCEVCQQVFTAEAGRTLRQTEAERVRQQLEG
jgi:hypothetical protein